MSGTRRVRQYIHLQEFALHGWRESRSGDGIRQGFKTKPNAASGSLAFPGESGGAEDGGVGLLELGIYELDLVLPEREDVVVHRTEDRLGEELLASGETAEENDGCQHTYETAQQAEYGECIHLFFHTVFLIEEPPSGTELGCCGQLFLLPYSSFWHLRHPI